MSQLDQYKRERRLYHKTCEEVATFVGLEKDALKWANTKFARLSFSSKWQMYPKEDDSKDEGFECVQKFHCPSLIPFRSYKKRFMKVCRTAAHFSILNHVYDADPFRAHLLLRGERNYEILSNFSFGSKQRARLKIARAVLNRVRAPEGVDRFIEKKVYFDTTSYGLKRSFAAEGNSARNIYLGVAAVSAALFLGGALEIVRHYPPDLIEIFKILIRDVIEPINNAKKPEVMVMNLGAVSTICSTLATPLIFYKEHSSLTPQNLKKFTEIERRYLLAFPRSDKSLEERLEELKKHRFPV